MHTQPHDLPSRIETPRLLLRPYQDGDGPAYYAVCRRNREHLLPYEAGDPALDVETEKDAAALVRDLAAAWANHRVFFLGAWHKHTGEWVAQVVLSFVSRSLPELAVPARAACARPRGSAVRSACRTTTSSAECCARSMRCTRRSRLAC